MVAKLSGVQSGTTVSKKKKKKKICSPAPFLTQSCNDGSEMFKMARCTCRVVVLLM